MDTRYNRCIRLLGFFATEIHFGREKAEHVNAPIVTGIHLLAAHFNMVKVAEATWVSVFHMFASNNGLSVIFL